MRTRTWLLPLLVVGCSSSPQAASPPAPVASGAPLAASTGAPPSSSSSASNASSAAPVDDLSAFPAPPAACVASWTIETCAQSAGAPPSAGVSFSGGLLSLSSRDVPEGCATPTNPKDALAVKLTQAAPDGDFEATAEVDSIDGTATTNAVLFLADPKGQGGALAEALLGGDATSFGAAVHTRDETKGKSDGANAPAKRGPGTLTIARKGKTITVSAARLDGKPLTKTIPVGAGPYVLGIGLRSTAGKGTASVGFGDFTVKDKSGKLKADDFECAAAK